MKNSLMRVAAILCLLFVAVPAAAQDFVAGTVLEAGTLRPLAGTQVVVEGTNLGAITDAAGKFMIRGVGQGELTLRFERIGYQTATRSVPSGTADVRVMLGETAVDLDELVVTGTVGATQKRALGNSLGSINAEEVLQTQPVTSVGELLQARVPGVAVTEQMGVAGGGSRILMRGPGSLSFAGDPLIYVDGVRINSDPATGPSYGQAGGAGAPSAVSRLNDINPADIESIEIIKGPAAATLYGTEASAGVIQIITKKGARGQMRVNARIRQGTNSFNDANDRLPTTYGWNALTSAYDSLTLNQLEELQGEPIFRTGHRQGYGVSISGGTDDIRYYTGLDYEMNEGVIPVNDDESFSGRLNLSVTPREDLTADVGFSMMTGETGLYNALYFGSVIYSHPWYLQNEQQGFLIAPARVFADVYDYTQYLDRYQATTTLTHRPASWLNHRLTAGFDLSDQRMEVLVPVVPEDAQIFFSPIFNRGGKDLNRVGTTYTTLDYSATAALDVTESLGSATSVGAQYYRTFRRFESISGSEFPAPGVTSISGASIVDGSESSLEQTTVGLYVQQQLSWENRLFLTVAVRADDHSAFGADFDLVTYPKVSASWVVTEEPFWTFDFVNALKLRAAYGESGQQPATFAAIRTYSPITGENDLPAGSPQAPGNPDLGPERGREIEVGFEAGLFNDRVGLDFTYYDQSTRDVIIQRSVAPSAGFGGTQFINAGEISNRGFEAAITAVAHTAAALVWDVGLKVSKNANEVVDLGVDAEFIATGWIPNRHQEGFPVNSYFRKKIVDAELDADGNLVNVLCDGGTGGQGIEPGGAAVPCGDAPLLYLGKPYHDWVGSFNTSVTLFDRVRVAALLDFKYGGQIFESVDFWNCNALLNHEVNVYPERFPPEKVAECRWGLTYIGTTRIQDNGYTKLRELSLSYQVPDRWAGLLGATAATLSVAGRNLYTWTDYDGLDPEVYTPVNYMFSAHTELAMPLPRSFMTTVSLTF